jgi:uncharacterized membrane protein
MKTSTFLAVAIALVFAAGTVAPSLADAAQTLHGGGGHGGGYRGSGAYHGSGYHGGVYLGGTPEAVTAAVTTADYGGVCGLMQVVLGLCVPYGY